MEKKTYYVMFGLEGIFANCYLEVKFADVDDMHRRLRMALSNMYYVILEEDDLVELQGKTRLNDVISIPKAWRNFITSGEVSIPKFPVREEQVQTMLMLNAAS